MFNSGQGLLYQGKSFIAGEQFGRSSISQKWQRRGQPVGRFLLIAEDGDCMGNYGHEACDHTG